MDISNQMLEAVAAAKRQAKSAERSFENATAIINIKTSSTIDLFGGSAVSQVADIASSVRKACDELYASYQSLVLTLDQKCRPLLSREPSTRAVKEVLEMIKWLNSESEIGSNFTGTLNGSALGDLASVRYFASMECQMIQKHWENAYAAMPGTAEEDRAFRQRQSDERLAARQAEREARRLEREWERQERERERQERETELRERIERNAAQAEKTAARRRYVKPAHGMMSTSMYAFACVKPDGTVDLFHRFLALSDGTPGDVSRFTNIKAVACTSDGVVGLRHNGTCIATNPGRYCDAHILEANQWRGVCALAAGSHHVVGLRVDGTCVANSIKWNVGYGYSGQSDVGTWRDIVAVACGDYFTIGLKHDGTVVHTGDSCGSGVTGWKDIVLIAAGGRGAVGVTSAGQVVSTGTIGIDAMERAENIVQLAVSRGLAYAVQADGTVVGGRKDTYEPTKKRVVTNHAVAIAGGDGLLVLKENGSVEQIAGSSFSSLKFPAAYRLLDSYDGYMQAKLAAEEARKKQEQQRKAYREAGVCQSCGGAFKKTLFGIKCTQCGKKKDY